LRFFFYFLCIDAWIITRQKRKTLRATIAAQRRLKANGVPELQSLSVEGLQRLANAGASSTGWPTPLSSPGGLRGRGGSSVLGGDLDEDDEDVVLDPETTVPY
jgi:hypothetical protein